MVHVRICTCNLLWGVRTEALRFHPEREIKDPFLHMNVQMYLDILY